MLPKERMIAALGYPEAVADARDAYAGLAFRAFPVEACVRVCEAGVHRPSAGPPKYQVRFSVV